MSEEKVYLKGHNYEITSSKVVVESTTYALRNIAGTSIQEQKQGGKIVGWTFIIIGILFFIKSFFSPISIVSAIAPISFLFIIGFLFIKFFKDKWFVKISSGGIQSNILHNIEKKPVQDVVDAINQALLDLDSNKEKSKAQKVVGGSELSANELTKLKGLLDEGVITQEDFDAKKKEILGL